jgi:hypothetical protein
MNKSIFILLSYASLTACASLPRLNSERSVEVKQLKDVVACEIGAAAIKLGPKKFKLGSWDVKSSLDLTLVQQLDADGKLAWIIPVSNTLTPSASLTNKNTSIAHIDFVTLVRDAEKLANERGCVTPDASQTGVGLAEWIISSFEATKEDNAGLTYTREFEITTVAGPRFGFAFVNSPVTGEIGGGLTKIDTNRLTVSISPHVASVPTEVIIVGEKKALAAGTSSLGRRQEIITNPIGNMNLLRQSPVRLQPGTTLLR